MSRRPGKRKKFSHAPEKIIYPGPRVYGYADKVQDLQGRKKLISYQVPSVNAEKEMKVIHAVILREKHKTNLMDRVSKHKPVCIHSPNGDFTIDEVTLKLIHHLQISTIKMLESIESWRLELTRTYPFMWEQRNYVQSLARDMDIVYFNKAMKQYLRRGSKKNPFLTPNLQLAELYELLCTSIVAKITKIKNEINRQAIKQVDEVMKNFSPEVTPLRLRDSIKMILEEQETWGPADGVLVAPVWASEAQEARNRLFGTNKTSAKVKNANQVKQKASPSTSKSKIRRSKKVLQIDKLKGKPYAAPLRFGMKLFGRYFAFTAQDISSGKTKVTAFDTKSYKYHGLFVLRSELKKAFAGNPNLLKQLRSRQRKYRLIIQNLHLAKSNILDFDCARIRRQLLKKVKKRTEKNHFVQYHTFKTATKIGHFWCAVALKYTSTLKHSQITITPLMYPSVKQLLKVKDDIFDAIRKSISTDALGENDGNTTSTKSDQQIKPSFPIDEEEDSSKRIRIIRLFLFECLICAGSPPVFFIQEPFTSRPSTRIRDQIEQVEAGIPYYSRPSTRDVYTPSLVQDFAMPEDDIMRKNIPARPPSINDTFTETTAAGSVRLQGEMADSMIKDSNNFVQTVPISDIYFIRYATKVLSGKRYLVHMYTHVHTDAKNSVCLRLYPICSNTYVANDKVGKASKELQYNFDRLLIEKLYVNDNEHFLDFEEGREGLLNISKLLKNHLNVLNDSQVVLENLRILKTPEEFKVRIASQKLGRKGHRKPFSQRQSPKISTVKKKARKNKLDEQLMPIFKPMLERQLSAEGHKRARRPYTANTWRDHQHLARTFLRKLAREAQARAIQEAQTDEHIGKQSYAKYWLTQRAKEAYAHNRRQHAAKQTLLKIVKTERDRLHRKILQSTTERQHGTEEGRTVISIMKI